MIELQTSLQSSNVIQWFTFQLKNLQRAVPCAYTYLQKNPEDQEMQQLMKDYKSQYDLNGYLIDHEEQPYEVRTRSFIHHTTHSLPEFNNYTQKVREVR